MEQSPQAGKAGNFLLPVHIPAGNLPHLHVTAISKHARAQIGKLTALKKAREAPVTSQLRRLICRKCRWPSCLQCSGQTSALAPCHPALARIHGLLAEQRTLFRNQATRSGGYLRGKTEGGHQRRAMETRDRCNLRRLPSVVGGHNLDTKGLVAVL